jgi:hypothetical protein
MATLVLQAAGAAIGSIFGPVGTVIGRAIGGLAGYAIDQSLFGTSTEGARLSDLDVQASREGAAIPRVYGRVRLAGQVIWATRYEEESEEEGGKGGLGATVTAYSYFANFAVGLCEGPIARIGRVWADGKAFDLSKVNCRIYLGDETQMPDSLIEAKQGEAGAPAYRGTAYVVFERLALEDFGNRIPQLSFEVIRPVAGIEEKVRAVTIIPGATEFGYDPERVRESATRGKGDILNRHLDGADTDWQASLDDLQAVAPNLERVGLVVAWFGDDLRAGTCTLMPGVVDRTTATWPQDWSAAGLTRADARLVSTVDGKPAYGGTPSDGSVVRAIRDLGERGLKVTFYPFIMMDVPAGNGLADPYGGAEQGAYPWRGAITASVAPGRPGSADKTEAAADEIAAFVGTAAPGDFAIAGEAVTYSGPDEWTLRRQVLHYANLCAAAGGVDAFLIGSELRGLSTLRSDASTYPFVAALKALAADVRTVLGPDTKISYAADWSEFFGHQPADGTGDVFFHLDPLWSDAAVDFVGIDNYMPLSDWRDGDDHRDAADWESGRDKAYLQANIAGGEGFDWYYQSGADRAAQTRTAIADGAYGRPWVYRFKDLSSWWANEHFDRPGGAEAASPTGWVPEGKPIWFTELGCPAVDKGPNQPNVFPDPKSSAGGLPYFSSGLRDDLAQRRFIAAHLSWWDADDPDFDAARNPPSSAYDGRMVEADSTHLWTWDARPYPAFPYLDEVWSDGANWETGHWLTGRLGLLSADALLAAIIADYGIDPVEIGELDGMLDGFVIPQVTSARQALEPLSEMLMFDAVESGDRLRFRRRARPAEAAVSDADFAEEDGRPLILVKRAQETDLPAEIALGFTDSLADFRQTSVNSRRLVTLSRRNSALDTAAVLSHAVAGGIADAILQDLWAARETLQFALPGSALGLEPADIVTLAEGEGERTLLVTKVEDAGLRRIEARAIVPDMLAPVPAPPRADGPRQAPTLSAPEILLLDLPLLSGDEPGYAPRIAAFAAPWPGAVAVAIGSAETGFQARQTLTRRAVVGELTEALDPGPVARFDRSNAITVRLSAGSLSGVPELALLNGSNIAAIGSEEDGWEIVQYQEATLTGTLTYRLSGLLRGQAGTADRAAAGHAAGARFVRIDQAVVPLSISEAESGLELDLRAGAAGAVYSAETFTDRALIAARRGLRCPAPVRLKGRRDGGSGDVRFSWIRQTRTGGDAWEPAEVPLGEAAEAYRVDILDGDETVRTIATAAPSAAYSAADQTADFGGLPAILSIRVSQVSPTEGPGLAAEKAIHV